MGRKNGSKNKKKATLRLPKDEEKMIDAFVAANSSSTTSPSYIAKIRIAGRECSAKGTTLDEAVLNLKPLVKKGVGILTIRHGDKEIEKILSGPTTFKLFNTVSRLTKEIAFKNLKTLFTL